MLQQGIYPSDYMNGWKKFNETLLPEKWGFYSHINMEDIVDVDYTHTKRVGKEFKIKNFGEYYDLYVQSDTFLLADVFEYFRNMSYNIWDWPHSFSFCIEVSMASCLEKSKIRTIN